MYNYIIVFSSRLHYSL